jgi:hypothetical protein
MSWNRNPAETDPLLLQSSRDDFSDSVERSVVDGGVRDGYIEGPHWPGLVLIAVAFIVVAAVVVAIYIGQQV